MNAMKIFFTISCFVLFLMTPLTPLAEDFEDTFLCRYAFPPKLQDGVYPHHYRPDRNVDYKHLKLEIQTFMQEQRVEGTAHYTFQPIHEGVEYVRIDAVEMDVERVECQTGQAIEWNHSDDAIHIYFQEALSTDDEINLSIEYSAEPEANLWFTDPDHVAPKNPDQIYTLNEPFGGSRWFPAPDYPDDRMVTEMVVTVPSELKTLSNGLLIDSTENGEWRTDHWKQEIPHVIYLVSLVVGDFVVVEEEWRDIPVTYYVMPEYEDDAIPSMGKTPEMLEFFSNYLDSPYPYEKYAQVMVRDFRAGGMEHTTATTMMEECVIPDRARLDHTMEWLIAHELAHQWFGDLVTCESWPQLWLNEGFASYWESLWAEHSQGEDEFLEHVWGDMNSYIGASNNYTRPIVTNRFEKPDEMFDAHSYPKGASVLHMLRSQLGDNLFRKSIQLYLKKHEIGLVDTDDLMEAIDEATGRPMDRFFEQWVYRPGHPKLKVSHEWIQKDKQVKVAIEQTQEMEEGAPAFAFPLEIEIATDEGRKIETVNISKKEESAFFDCEKAPESVVIDPYVKVLIELDHEKSQDMLLEDLQNGSTVIVRMRAAKALGKFKTHRVTDALAEAMNNDPYHAVQEDAASSLGNVHTPYALEKLLEAADHPNPETRDQIASALGEFYQNEEAYDALVKMFKNDESIRVVSNAANALAKLDLDKAAPIVQAGVKIDSYFEKIRNSSINALVKLEDSRAWNVLKKYSQDPHGRRVRTNAIRAIGRFAYETESHQEEALELLLKYLDSGSDIIQSAAISGLGALKHKDAIPHLRRMAEHAEDGFIFTDIAKQAKNAIDSINRERGDELPGKNEEKIEQMEKKQKELEDTIKDLQNSIKGLKTQIKENKQDEDQEG